jgi:hypothetical protein
VVAAICLGPAHAAPTTGSSDAAATEIDAAAVHGALLPPPSAGHGEPSTSRTIRMLLELQGAPPPLEGASGPRRHSRAEAASAQVTPAGMELTSSTPGTAVVAAGKVDWRSGLPGRAADVGAAPPPREGYSQSRPARSGSPDEVEAIKALLPAKLIALLREYREWLIVGGLFFLTLLGLGASTVSHRRG